MRMTYAKQKAQDIYIMGESVVSEEEAENVLKELEAYNGNYYEGVRMNGCVSIEKAKETY